MKKLICCLFCLTIMLQLSVISFSIDVNGKSAIVIEADTGEIIYEKNSSEKLPMASTTKIMTALVAIENGDLNKKVKVSKNAAGVEGSSIYLTEGEQLTMEDLLYALMLESANDAAAAIAFEVAGGISDFAALMNKKAVELGLTNTHFTNPHGLDNEAHYTTAYDLARLASFAMKNETFAKIVSTYKHTIPLKGDEGTRLLLNHNRMLKYYDGATGVKTGFTKKSGRCLVTAASRNGVNLVAVTLSDPNDWRDHTDMLDYGFSVYTSITLAQPGELVFDIPCTGGTSEFVRVVNRDGATVAVKNHDEPVKCTLETKSGALLFAPIEENFYAADAVFTMDGHEICRIPLYTSEAVKSTEPKKGFFDIFK